MMYIRGTAHITSCAETSIRTISRENGKTFLNQIIKVDVEIIETKEGILIIFLIMQNILYTRKYWLLLHIWSYCEWLVM